MKIRILIIRFVFPIGSDWLPFGTKFQIGKSDQNQTKIRPKSDIRFVDDLDYFDQWFAILKYFLNCYFLCFR